MRRQVSAVSEFRAERPSSKGKALERGQCSVPRNRRDFCLAIVPKIWAIFQPYCLALGAAQRILLLCGSASRYRCPPWAFPPKLGPLASRRRPFFTHEELRCSAVIVSQINAEASHVGPASG